MHHAQFARGGWQAHAEKSPVRQTVLSIRESGAVEKMIIWYVRGALSSRAPKRVMS